MRVTSSAKAFFEVVDVLIERFSWGFSSQKSKGFARGCQGFLGCEISFFCKQCIQNVNLFIKYFSRKFNCRVMPVWKSNEFSNLFPLSYPQRENIVNEFIPRKRFSSAKVQYFCFYRRYKGNSKWFALLFWIVIHKKGIYRLFQTFSFPFFPFRGQTAVLWVVSHMTNTSLVVKGTRGHAW